MAGTIAGGKLAAQKNLARDPDFYKRIGSRGGSKTGIEKGFSLMSYEKRAEAGRKGGRISKRKLSLQAW
jgi:general stress protein YciG